MTDCDPPATQWPLMQAHGREKAGFGFVEADLHFAACWTGYTDASNRAYDAPPFSATSPSPVRTSCPSRARSAGSIQLPTLRPFRVHRRPPCPTDDKASNLAVSSLGTANQVTVYACYDWRPPLAGFLLDSRNGAVARDDHRNPATPEVTTMTPAPRGQILILGAVAMVVLLGIAALVVDLGFGWMLRRQEQNAVDPAAVAAARYIPDIPTTRLDRGVSGGVLLRQAARLLRGRRRPVPSGA